MLHSLLHCGGLSCHWRATPGSACQLAPCQPPALIAPPTAELFEHAGSGRLDSAHSQQIDWGNRCGGHAWSYVPTGLARICAAVACCAGSAQRNR